MIPKNLTHAEVGAFFIAVGKEMMARDVCFDAALDGNSDDIIVNDILKAMQPDDVSWERAYEILQLTGEEAINFNSVEAP